MGRFASPEGPTIELFGPWRSGPQEEPRGGVGGGESQAEPRTGSAPGRPGGEAGSPKRPPGLRCVVSQVQKAQLLNFLDPGGRNPRKSPVGEGAGSQAEPRTGSAPARPGGGAGSPKRPPRSQMGRLASPEGPAKLNGYTQLKSRTDPLKIHPSPIPLHPLHLLSTLNFQL